MNVWGILSLVADIVSIIGITITIYQILRARAETRRLREEIERERNRKARTITLVLELQSDDGATPAQRKYLPFTLRRAELARAEVMGRLAMAQTNQSERFDLAYLHKVTFLEQIAAIADGDNDAELIIPCSLSEFQLFEVKT